MSNAEKLNIIVTYLMLRQGWSLEAAIQQASENLGLDFADYALAELIEKGPYRRQ